MVSQGVFSVDTFFLLSGILCSYLFMKEIAKRGGKIQGSFMAKFYIHRLWRITPPYALMIMVAAALTRYMGSGPFYPYEKGLDPNCRTNWWTNLLYVNNLVNTPKMCFGISWYLANDMQFYFFSPLLLIPLALGYEIVGFIIAGSLIVFSMVITSILLYADKGSELGVFATNTKFMQDVYFTPWCRMGPFLVGAIVGYMIYKYKKKNYKINKVVNLMGWFISLFFIGLMVFGTYDNQNPNPVVHLNRAENILFQSTCRPIWAMALGFMIFSCTLGQGGIMNEMFSWQAWVPLSRLSFSAYLAHMSVIYWYNYQALAPIPYTELIMSYEFVGHMVMSYAFALVIALLFESPLVGLEKFIFKFLH